MKHIRLFENLDTLSREDKKNILIRFITSETYTKDGLKKIEDSLYRTIYKVPTDMFILGLIGDINIHSYKGEKIDINIDDIKELLPEIISDVTGYETTFIDDDWENLEIIKNEYGRDKLNSTKAFIGDFFEK